MGTGERIKTFAQENQRLEICSLIKGVQTL